MDSIAILDFGSQYAQVIARRVREAQVYCELFPWDASMEKILSIAPKGFILSGGPKSVYEEAAPYIQEFIFKKTIGTYESNCVCSVICPYNFIASFYCD